jgi:hypothetical protein
MIPDYDPSLGLGEQMRRMSYGQWLETLNDVFNSLFYLCCRVVVSLNFIILKYALS